MKKKTVVYRIVSKINGKSYVGSSWRFAKRWVRHFSDLKSGCHHSKVMQADFNQYGKDNFEHEILEEFEDSKDARLREKYWIDHFDSHSNGYNASWHGLYRTMTREERLAHNKFMKEIWNTDEKREYAKRRAIKQFSSKKARVEASNRQKDFIKNNPERAFAISSLGGKIGSINSREVNRKEIIRGDGKKYLAINDAAREMNPGSPESARHRIKQALRRGNKTYDHYWSYL